ncbi:hypothetical protein BGZ83_012182 [Gryganskiella cystojenkinii]|nr:hypothetical protein BGZ83_012182 [Gryganskiella cystojenkinii]
MQQRTRGGGVFTSGPYDTRYTEDSRRTDYNSATSGTDQHRSPPTASINYHSGDTPATERYSGQYMFTVLLAVFSCVPTTIFLGWIISWAVLILYVCTVGFAIAIVTVIVFSMFVYGPILCCCIVGAISVTGFYHLSFCALDLYQASKSAVLQLAHMILPTLIWMQLDRLLEGARATTHARVAGDAPPAYTASFSTASGKGVAGGNHRNSMRGGGGRGGILSWFTSSVKEEPKDNWGPTKEELEGQQEARKPWPQLVKED